MTRQATHDAIEEPAGGIEGDGWALAAGRRARTARRTLLLRVGDDIDGIEWQALAVMLDPGRLGVAQERARNGDDAAGERPGPPQLVVPAVVVIASRSVVVVVVAVVVVVVVLNPRAPSMFVLQVSMTVSSGPTAAGGAGSFGTPAEQSVAADSLPIAAENFAETPVRHTVWSPFPAASFESQPSNPESFLAIAATILPSHSLAVRGSPAFMAAVLVAFSQLSMTVATSPATPAQPPVTLPSAVVKAPSSFPSGFTSQPSMVATASPLASPCASHLSAPAPALPVAFSLAPVHLSARAGAAATASTTTKSERNRWPRRKDVIEEPFAGWVPAVSLASILAPSHSDSRYRGTGPARLAAMFGPYETPCQRRIFPPLGRDRDGFGQPDRRSGSFGLWPWGMLRSTSWGSRYVCFRSARNRSGDRAAPVLVTCAASVSSR